MSNNYANNANLTAIMIKVGNKIKEKDVGSTATGTALVITDAASGYVQSVTVKGNSEVVSGEMVSVGDDGLTITSTDGTASTTATITTGLPLRSVGSVYDTMTNGLIVKRCAEIDLGDLTWSRGETTTSGVYNFYTYGLSPLCLSNNNAANGVCADYAVTTIVGVYYGTASDKSIAVSGNTIRIRDDSYTDTTAFKTALAGVKLIYILATRTTLSLSSAETTALKSLRTYSGTTSISATDSPVIVIDYLKNTDNGKAVATVDNKVIGKQDKLTFDSTPTANSSNPVTSAGIKTALDTKQNALTAGTNITISEDQQSGNLIISASAGSSGSGETFPAKYKTWANATDTEIAELLAAHNAGEIDIYDRWRAGERRKLHFSQMTLPTDTSGTWTTDSTPFTMDAVLYNCGYPGTGNEDIHYIIGLEYFPYKLGMNFYSDTSTTGGYKESNIRSWLINEFYGNISQSFKNLLKPITYEVKEEYNSNTMVTLSDKVVLPAVREITTGANTQRSYFSETEYLFEQFFSPGNGYIYSNPNSNEYILTRTIYGVDETHYYGCGTYSNGTTGHLITTTNTSTEKCNVLMLVAI